jgi:hypothetical protein
VTYRTGADGCTDGRKEQTYVVDASMSMDGRASGRGGRSSKFMARYCRCQGATRAAGARTELGGGRARTNLNLRFCMHGGPSGEGARSPEAGHAATPSRAGRRAVVWCTSGLVVARYVAAASLRVQHSTITGKKPAYPGARFLHACHQQIINEQEARSRFSHLMIGDARETESASASSGQWGTAPAGGHASQPWCLDHPLGCP